MRYLFWNTNKKNVDEIICKLVEEYRPSILALAEYTRNLGDLANSIEREAGIKYVPMERMACRVDILVNEKIGGNIEHCADHKNFTIKILPYNSYHDTHIVAFVHLPSKMQENREKNRYLLEQITTKINALDVNKNRKVLIFGDFNLNPYEEGMTYLTGCNAVSTRRVAMRISRKDRYEEGKEFYYYYNPMWNFLGDFREPHGTYFYDKTVDHSRYWNTFDQFVVSPELIKDIKEIEILRGIKDISLMNKNGVPSIDISDHFPLFFRLGG